MDIHKTNIIGNKKHLKPEQPIILTMSASSFTAPQTKNLQNTFLPKEKTVPLEKQPPSLENQEKNISPRNFIYTNSVTLKNKYGITDYGKLQMQCAHDSAKAIINLRQEAPPQKLTSAYLLYIHHTLFKNTFEWAGKTREKPFTFKDGTVACMPEMKKANISFASGKKVQEGLENLDRTLTEKNNFKGLSREAFVENAAEMMIQLNYTHPFREGNGRTQRMFFEKLAEVAGHKLDFSLITQERMNLASIVSVKSGDSEPMKHLFDDISNPEKTLILKEFIDHMKKIGVENMKERLVLTAKEEETYTGFYRGGGANGFMIDVKGTFIIGDKKHLAPEQLKTLKIGDAMTFTVPKAQDLQQILIPAEKIAPLTKEEIIERIKKDTSIQARKQTIEVLCKIVYGNPHILEEKLEKIHEDPLEGEKLACQIIKFPKSISKLAGINISGIINNRRAHAKENIFPLCIAIDRYADTFKQVEQDILRDHYAKQKRCEQLVEIPREWIKDLCTLSKEQQQKTLSQSLELREEIRAYSRKINARLSPSEHEAIKEKDYERLAQIIGTSVNKAQEIAKIVQSVKEIRQSIPEREFSCRTFEEHSGQNLLQTIKENSYEKYIKIFNPTAMKTEKTIEITMHDKTIQQSIQPRKAECARAMSI
ncbi:Probable adenosine monophosphate-protein transferase fic [Bartonella vinsonii]|uniref:protein adenylyltransferase n=2 Tax=Bartonella vinsonii TaxID=33047 RepID=A0A3S5A138_BARVI|nr:Probable adenosine monophosphate-protein transferase fic [Bartonella vinsonii]